MPLHPLAGKPAPVTSLVDVDALIREYFQRKPDLRDQAQCVSFGTSGHRGSSLDGAFNEMHILAISQAICDYRSKEGITGPLFLGKDTHALSAPAHTTALRVLAANGVQTIIQANEGYTPTPAISLAILNHNLKREQGLADGIVITPSHNPPKDGGFKYNATNGGPADTDATNWIQDRANELLRAGKTAVQAVPSEAVLNSATIRQADFMTPYIDSLASIIDFDVIRSAKLKLAVNPLGGASVHYWQPIAEKYGLDITVVNDKVDPTFRFLTLDHDGQIRMDCSSPYTMAGLVALKNRFDLAFANDTDADRHGIVSRSSGLLNPNHYLSVAIEYLFTHRPSWPKLAGVGKTLVSSSMIDRVAADIGRRLVEVPVGFKWFVNGLYDGTLGFGGEESAGASFLRKDGSVWTTDKDGLIMNLLAAEITARMDMDPGELYRELTAKFGVPHYKRVDQAVTLEQKSNLKKLSPESVRATKLAGDDIISKVTKAPGNNAPIGGLKVVTENGWFAARPSGTENVCKIYAESFKSERHLAQILEEAAQIVDAAIAIQLSE